MQLLKHADLLVYDGEWRILKNGYVGIAGDTICYVSSIRPKQEFETEKDLSGHLLMTGFYNMHTHTSMTLLRGLGSGLPLDRWLHEAMFPIEARLTQADISVGTRLAMMEMLACGVVSFTDMYDMPHITAEEVLQAGMRASLCRPLLAFNENEPYESNWRVPASRELYAKYNGAGDGRLIVDFGIHAEYTSHAAQVRQYGEECMRAGARMHMHLSETRKEHEGCKARHGKTPTRWFYELGVLDNPTIAAHCVMVEPDDIKLMLEKGVTCVHNPSSNMKLGSGFMPMQMLLDSGVHLTIGTDGAASNNNQNLMEEIHIASIIHNGYTGDPTIMKPENLLLMATKNGAAAQGREDCGELAVGKKADLIAVRLDTPHMMPAHDIPALLVYSAQASDVAMTMVGGKTLYENSVYNTIDFERVKFDLKETINRLFG